MARIDFLQFKHNQDTSNYSVLVSFNGAPVAPTISLNFINVLDGFAALGPIGMDVKTYSFSSPDTHLNQFDHGDLGKIYEGVVSQVRGGGIIKTTNYPPPYNRVDYFPVNAALLADLYVQELTISRVGASDDFTVSVTIANKPNHFRKFEIESQTFTVGQGGLNTRAVLAIKIKTSTAPAMPRSFSTVFNNAGHLRIDDPCTLILHEGNYNPASDYFKNGWFFIH